MGKSRRNRSGTASHRADPISGPPKAVKEPSDPALAALRNAKILPVVKDLRSSDPKTRSTAAGAIANIVEDARCRKLLLREQIVHVVLTETLADDGIESRSAGWSVLNVLAQHEEADFCVHLYRCDVLTPAALALSQIRETLAGSAADSAKLTKAQKDFMWRITSSILDLVGQLSEARDEILASVAANADITRALFALAAGVSNIAVPFEIQWAALTALTRLCEDEKQRTLAEVLVDDQKNGGCYAGLLKLQEAGGPLAVAASSLLHAVFTTLEWFDHSPGRDGVSDASLIPTLSGAIEKQLAQEGVAVKEDKISDEERDRSTEVLGLALQTLAMIGTTLKASLEKANKDDAVWNGIKDDQNENGAAGDEDMVDDGEPSAQAKAVGKKASKKGKGKKAANSTGDDMEVDMEDAAEEEDTDDDEDGEDDEDDEDDFDLDQDMAKVTAFDDNDEDEDMSSGLEDLPTLRCLIDDAIPQIIRLIAARSEDADEDSVAILLDALSALNNVAWTVSLIDLKDEGNASILQSWDPVSRRIWLKVVRPLLAKELVDLDIADQVAGLAWALARVMRGETPSRAGEPARFMALRDTAAAAASKTKEAPASGEDADPFQTLAVKCIGVLGQMALEPASTDINRQIGQYLLGIATALPDSKSPPAEVIEALNQLFDIYGDETVACDKEVFWKDGMLAQFESVAPKIKALAKTIDKRTMSELRTRADEAILNLNRFNQYKKKHAS
ncbi:armadillo repeat protein [Ophiostoma piceae UAMH 11346]|uniref:Armadillo repeat protein n=1 Tax=Ophiostoma piceae (strain UAMH 11346) TaxID=1262450 RepID=S3D9F6_OPHP1|nr:armadillo repeat protein [Ophiostoma piceae UAMH 11346]